MKSIIILALFFLVTSFKHPLVSQSLVTHYDKAEYELMDNLALWAGTDKSSAFHNYTRIYSRYFKECKNKPIKFLEIGIYKGDSVRFWEAYFSKAELHFIDITDKHIHYHSSRASYHLIDQTNVRELRRFASVDGPFDIILDDGGHTMHQQISSFLALFPHLKSGGLYIIEDLHTSYWKSHGGSGNIEKANEGTTIGYLKDLIDHINFPGAASACADASKLPDNIKVQMNDFRQQIESIRFYTSICIIEKK
jgi:Methyltransferase domain